jgi:hypothetical protein
MINRESATMDNDDNEAMTKQHVRVAIAETTLYSAELGYEMAAAALDRASHAVARARSVLADEQQALSAQRAQAQVIFDELRRKAEALMKVEGDQE